MVEVAPVPSSKAARLLPARGRRNRLNALEALERGFALFRSTFAQEAWCYYAGAMPLVLCFIPMWVANGQIQMSDGALLLEAALLAAGYVLRVWMVGKYMQRVRERAFGTARPKTVGVISGAAALGRLLAWKITFTAGVLAAIPTVAGASWLYSASQFASLEAQDDSAGRHSMAGCLALSSQWFGGSLLLFLMLCPAWIAVWLNGFILAILFPQLLHSIFGVDTLLSTLMGALALVRSSAFWLALFAGAWLALDPIVKCTFVNVHQHFRSRSEGDDLRGLLANLPREQAAKAQMIASTAAGSSVKVGALVVLAVILAGAPQTGAVSATQQQSLTQSTIETASDSAREPRVQKLREALDAESQRAIYRWHDAEHVSAPTWVDKLLAKVGRGIERAWNAVENFLGKLWPRGLDLSPGTGKSGTWHLKDLRFWLALLAIVALSAVAVLFWLRRRREAVPLSIPLAIAPLPDLSDVAVASASSEDEWFALAGRLEGQGDLRLALRAAYFGLLAGLAQREWLTIRRDRTNREYFDEFARRWRRRPQAALAARTEILDELRGSLRQFDAVWYGFHVLTPAAVAKYRQDQRELLGHV